MPHDLASPLPLFLGWCDKLGLAPQSARQPALMAAIKTQSHESVLFFLCGRDYVYNPTDLKLHGIEELFIGPTAPFQINLGEAVADNVKKMLHAPGVNVKTETGGAHTIAAVPGHGPGVRAGGAGNYNLGTQVLGKACAGLGPKFLNDVLTAVTDGRRPSFVAGVSDHRIFVVLQNMRNRARRFWINDMPEIGL